MNGIPLYALGLTYIGFSLIFPDRWNYIAGFVICLVLWLASRSIGRRVFSNDPSIPDSWLFPAGLGIVLAVAAIIISFSTERWLLSFIVGRLSSCIMPGDSIFESACAFEIWIFRSTTRSGILEFSDSYHIF